MATTPSGRALPHGNVGTLGHHRHGKTTLLAALLKRLAERADGYATPRAVPELSRPWVPAPGEAPTTATRALRSVEYETPQRHWSHLDLPGMRRHLRLASRGMSGLDAGVLVVSAAEGAAAQTREHVLHARGLGARRLVVFLNQCDLVAEPDWIDEVERDTRQVLDECGLAGDEVPFVRGAALPYLQGDSNWVAPLDHLIEALDHDVELPARQEEGPGLMLVEERYDVRGRGTVAMGTVLRGSIRVGQEVDVGGRGGALLRSVITSIERHNRAVQVARAGDTVGVLLRGLLPEDVIPGRVLGARDSLSLAVRVTCSLRMLSAREGGRRTPLLLRSVVQLCVGAAKVPARLSAVNPDGHLLLMPGDRRDGVAFDIVTGEAGNFGPQAQLPVWAEPGVAVAFRDGTQTPPPPHNCGRVRMENGRAVPPSVPEPKWGGTCATGVITAVEPYAPPKA